MSSDWTHQSLRVAVVIPALDEERALPLVLADIPDTIEEVIVVDNGSCDATPDVARAAGATVIREEKSGYGWACTAGVRHAFVSAMDVVLFLDGDYADHPDEAEIVLAPIREGRADFVVGSRTRGRRENGALLPQARFGNLLACFLIRLGWKERYTDLGPFRAIQLKELHRLDLKEMRYGWTVEMQIRAVQEGLRIVEVPVSYRCRIGQSKVTGTLSGTIKAGFRILLVIVRMWIRGLGSR